MSKFLFAAPASGSGKTTVTCAVLSALKRRGLTVHAFKCGPDYIDPMFHRAALGIPCHNLDLYLTSEGRLKTLFAKYSAGSNVTVVEGVMGFYDGVGGVTTEASAWHVANVLNLPVVLVVRPKGASLSLGNLVNGFQKVPSNAAELCGVDATSLDSHLRGIILSDCSEMMYRVLKPMFEKETGLPVLGFLPHMEDAQFESRHLGLVSAEEDLSLSEKLEKLADAAEAHIDIEGLLSLGELGSVTCEQVTELDPPALESTSLRIAVARDEAFQFCYDETLDAFREAGLEPVFFSPIGDSTLPEDISALYLPGGYPELHAKELSENENMKQSIREAFQNELPTIAECGGYLYLGKSLTTPEGEAYDMVGIYSGEAEKTNRPVRFGYAELTSKQNTLVADAGTPVRIHNFHYYESTDLGDTYLATKPVSGRSYETGFGTEHSYIGFPHLYFAGDPELCARIANAAKNYQSKNETR